MLTLEDILNCQKLDRALGGRSTGACFGVLDPSRLRPPFNEPLPHKKSRKKKIGVKRDKKTGKFIIIKNRSAKS